jgi:hypothetical protein
MVVYIVFKLEDSRHKQEIHDYPFIIQGGQLCAALLGARVGDNLIESPEHA